MRSQTDEALYQEIKRDDAPLRCIRLASSYLNQGHLADATRSAEMALLRIYDDWYVGDPDANVFKAILRFVEVLDDKIAHDRRDLGVLLAYLYAQEHDQDLSHRYHLVDAVHQRFKGSRMRLDGVDPMPKIHEVHRCWAPRRSGESLRAILRVADADARDELSKLLGLKGWSVDAAERKIRAYGGHTVANLWRGEGPTYAEIVYDVATKALSLPVAPSEADAPAILEERIAARLLEQVFSKMSPKDLEELLAEAGIKDGKVRAQILKTGGRTLLLSGLSVAVRQIIIQQAKRTMLDLLLRRAAAAPLAGPAGAAVLAASAAWAAFDLMGPAFRKTIPAVLTVASIRARRLAARASSMGPQDEILVRCPLRPNPARIRGVARALVGQTWPCECGFNVRFEGGTRGFVHEPILRVYCPHYRREVEVGGFEHKPRCPLCRSAILPAKGGFIHQETTLVACHAAPAHYTPVPIKEAATCAHCGGKISSALGVTWHEPFWLEHVSEALDASQRDRALFIIHGFMSHPLRRENYHRHWLPSARAMGWRGHVFGVHWDGQKTSPEILKRAVFEGASHAVIQVFEARGGGAAGGALGGAAGSAAVQIAENWKRAIRETEVVGELLTTRLLHPDPRWRRGRSFLGFSLGARVCFNALSSAARRGVTLAQQVVLCGGAAPTKGAWNEAARAVEGPIINLYSEHDMVLKNAYRAAEWEAPIGLGPISGAVRNIQNHNASPWVTGHVQGDLYEEKLPDIFRGLGLRL